MDSNTVTTITTGTGTIMQMFSNPALKIIRSWGKNTELKQPNSTKPNQTKRKQNKTKQEKNEEKQKIYFLYALCNSDMPISVV